MNQLLPNPVKSTSSRRGSGLLLAMMVLLTVTSLVIISTDNVQAVYTQLQMQGKEQMCKAAAEAVAGTKEDSIGDLITGARNQNDIDNYNMTIGGVVTQNHNYGQQWFANCLVKWRVEPFLVLDSSTEAPDTANYIGNPDGTTTVPSAPQQVNTDYYHYRIAAEATYFDSSGQSTCRAQAFRWIQITKNNLFRYALFYGQIGPAGDIEINSGSGNPFWIRGGIHSNGAIYVGGAGDPSVIANLNTGDETHFGPKTNPDGTTSPISVTGVDGLFRMRKKTNYLTVGSAVDPMTVANPLLYQSQDNRFINDILFSPPADTLRNPDWKTNSVSLFGGFVRTGGNAPNVPSTGAVVVKTLSNIPQLAGRPTEPQQLTQAATEVARQQLFWTDATESAQNTTTTTTNPFMTDGLYLDYALGTKESGGAAYSTINAPLAGTITNGTSIAMIHKISAGSATDAHPTKIGLIIRERPKQDTSIYASAVRPPVPNPGLGSYATDLLNYRNYMRSQYQVFLGVKEVTIPFINYNFISGGVAIPTVSEEDILNRRLFWSQNVYSSANYPMQNLLTLNMDAVQDYLKNTAATVADASYPAADFVKDHFNGLIYANRTNRNYLGLTIANPDFNRQAATPEMYTAAIRIARASNINWEHPASGIAPLGTSKLTIVTPNPAFLWGDYNSVTHNDSTGTAQITPCALMCDMVTVLSNSWSDSNAQSRSDIDGNVNIPTGNSATYNVALVLNNWPTDDDPVFKNKYDDASAHVFVWWMEQGGRQFFYKGSVVVLNSRRYGRGYNQGATRVQGVFPPGKASGTSLYGAPTRTITFNEDLQTAAGAPPFTPFGIQVTRQAGYVEVLGR